MPFQFERPPNPLYLHTNSLKRHIVVFPVITSLRSASNPSFFRTFYQKDPNVSHPDMNKSHIKRKNNASQLCKTPSSPLSKIVFADIII